MKCYVEKCFRLVTHKETVTLLNSNEKMTFFCCDEHLIPKLMYNSRIKIVVEKMG